MNSDTLYQLLECPICYVSMKPPIRQCEIGHTFCNSCCQRIMSCPICRGTISSSRAFHLEKISQTTEICKKCNKNIPLHCSVAHKDSCLNGSGDTNGERLESNSELDNNIQTTEFYYPQRRGFDSYSSSSDSSITNLLVFADSTDPDEFSDNYMIVADNSSENYVSSSDDDSQSNVIGEGNRFYFDTASSYGAVDKVSNGEYDAGNDGDESGEAESSKEEENEEEDSVDENVETDVDDEISEGEYYDDDEDDDDHDDEDDDDHDDDDEEEEVSEEEGEVSDDDSNEEPGSYFSDDDPQTSFESDDTGNEGNGDSSDCFFTTDESD